MEGEHPLDRKFKDKQGQALAKARAEGLERRRAEEVRTAASAAWPRDEVALTTAIKQSNNALQRNGKHQVYDYQREPQPGGDLFQSHVQLHDKQTGSTEYLEVRVTTEGAILTAFRGGGNAGRYAVGQTNVATWNELLRRLHDQLEG